MKPLWLLLLMSGGLVAQQVQPSATYVYPTGANAPLNTKVLVKAACCSYSVNSVEVRSGSQQVAGTTEIADLSDRWFVFTPAHPFQPRTSYTVTVSIPYYSISTFTFTTGADSDTTPPRLISTTPADGEDGVFSLSPVAIRFSEPINPVSLGHSRPALTLAGSDTSLYGVNWGMSTGDTVVSVLYSALNLGSAYRVYFPGFVPEDAAGNRLAGRAPDFVFTTYPEAPKDGARLTGVVPAEGEPDVPTNTTIFLLFDRPVVVPPASVFSLGSAADPKVAVKVEDGNGGTGLIVRPQLLLRANQEYTLSCDGLIDQYGGRYSGTIVRFRTGSLPEGRTFQAVSQPLPVMPRVNRLQWRFSRAVNPLVLPWLIVVNQVGPVTGPTARLLDDGVTIEADVPGPGRYALAGKVLDRALSQAAGFLSAVVVSGLADEQAPVTRAVFPSGATSAAPPSVQPKALFDEPLAALGADDVLLLRDGVRVTADVQQFQETLTIRPRAALPPGDYRMEVHGPRDLAGNVAPDLSWTFRVDTPTTAGPFRIESVEPADGTTGVDPRTPIVFRFNRSPNSVSLITYGNVYGSGNSIVAGRWRVEENQATFEPDGGLPPNTRVSWSLSIVSDFYGTTQSTAGGGFWTASGSDGEPFRVISVSPGPGETGVAGDRAIALQFNQAANAGTLNEQNIAVRLDRTPVGPLSISYDAANRRALINTQRFTAATVQIAAGAGVLSQSGAPLEPFTAEVKLLPESSGYSVSNTRQLGPFIAWAGTIGSGGVLYVGHSIVLAFYQPMPHDLVERALAVVVNGSRVGGRIEWTPDSRALTFTPNTPFQANTSGTVLLSMVPWGGSGVEWKTFNVSDYYLFTSNLRSNLDLGPLPYDAIIDLSYDKDMPANYIQSATAEAQTGPRTSFALEVKAISARVFRLRPPSPWLPDTYYSISFKTADGEQKRGFSTRSFPTPVTRQLDAGPTAEMGEAPVNTVVWLQSRTPLNPVPFRAEVTVDGAAVPYRTEFLDGGFLVLFRFYGLLRGNATYTVSLSGLEDDAGRPLPNRTWSFRTAAGPDVTQTKIVSSSPKGIAPASSALRVTFDKPVYFRRSQDSYAGFSERDFTVETMGGTIQGTISVSPDGRTLTFVPDRPWPLNTPVGANITRFFYFDWTSTSILDDLTNTTDRPGFITAATTGDALPTIDARNPYRDATNVPLNGQIQARFTEPVLRDSLGQVRIESDAGPVATKVTLESDGRTITLLPDRLETDNTYTVIVEGVQNGAGAPQEAADRWSFRTGRDVAGDGVSGTTSLLSTDPLAIRVDLPRPVNPVTVSNSSMSLSIRGRQVAVTARVDGDARAIFLEPAVPQAADSRCQFAGTGIRDWAGNSMGVSGSCAPSATQDTTAPRVESMLPRPGSSLRWTELAGLTLDEAFHLRRGLEGVRIKMNGAFVPASVGLLLNALVVRPAAWWTPGAECEIEVSGITDQFGSEAGPVRWNFTISPEIVFEGVTLRLLSSTPANNAVGVPPETPIELQYSKPVTPLGSFPGPTVEAARDNTRMSLTERYRPSYVDSTVRLLGPPLPASSAVTLSVPAADLSGRTIGTILRFDTAAVPDTTRPRIESITPAPGTQLTPGYTDFVVRFSEPVAVAGPAFQFQTPLGSFGSEVRSPAGGDGRTLVLFADVPAKSTEALTVLSGIIDLAGNAVEPVSFEYTSGEDTRFLRVLSFKPSSESLAPLEAPIELTFNQPIAPEVLASALTVWNDAVTIPVTLSPDAEGKVYRVIPSARWKEKSVVTLQIARTAYSTTGVFLDNVYTGSFRTVATTTNNSASNAVAAVLATAAAVDVRFSEPRDVLGGPFGIRIGQRRVAARVERMGPSWFRLTPDEPLEAGQPHVLMAGDGVELPLRIDATVESDAEAVAEMTAGSGVWLRLGRGMHPFGAASVRVVDEAGNALPCSASIVDGGRAARIEVYAGKASRVVWGDRRIAVGPARR